MSPTRRDFIRTSTLAGAALGLGGLGASCQSRPSLSSEAAGAADEPDQAPRPLDILVLGGTGFIGPHLVDHALARGHTVTLFNRGRTHAELFPDLEKLRGDRDDDLAALEGDRRWDAVVDTHATLPRWVRQSAGLLAGRAERYMFVSTLSVYADVSQAGMDEDTPVLTIENPELEERSGRTYGPYKALAEQEARAAFPEGAVVVRPGLIVGPGDPTDRFTYWPVRVDRGGEILAPGDGTDPVQFIDARDLTAWMVRLLEQRAIGTFNATGPAEELLFADMLAAMQTVASHTSTVVWAAAAWLAEKGVRAWSDMPVWIPPSPDNAGFSRAGISRALAAGLTFRPLVETVRDTLAWHATRPEEERTSMRSGLSPEREAELLEAWHAERG